MLNTVSNGTIINYMYIQHIGVTFLYKKIKIKNLIGK